MNLVLLHYLGYINCLNCSYFLKSLLTISSSSTSRNIMISQRALAFMLCLSLIHAVASMPVSSTKENYEVVKKKEVRAEPNDAVYVKQTTQRQIPQLFHAVELSKQNMKRQAKSLDKAKQRTPLEKGLWGKRVVIEASISNKLPQDYTLTAERVSEKNEEVDDNRQQNDAQVKSDALSSSSSLGNQAEEEQVLIPDDMKAIKAKKSTQYQDESANNIDDDAAVLERYGPIEKGLWGKRTVLPEDEIDQDLDSVIYFRKVNNVNQVRGMERDRETKYGKWKRYLILKRLDKSDDEADGKKNADVMMRFVNPVEKGLWGKRSASRGNEAYYNSLNEDYELIKNDMDSEVSRRAGIERSNLKPYKRIYLVS